MATYRFGSRYSRWDGTQQINPLDASEIMQALSDDLMQSGDINLALQRLFNWGFQRQDGEQVPGLRELMNRTRQRRQEQLNRYDLGSIFDDIKERLEQILATEREGIDRRVDEGRERLAQQETVQQGQQGEGAPGQSGQGDQAGESAPYDQDLQGMLERIADKKREQLDQLPNDPAGQIRGLNDYEFMDPKAREQFQELLAMLQQQVLQQTFQGMQQALGSMSPED